MSHKVSVGIIVVAVLILAGFQGCTPERTILPEGPQTLTGSIRAVPLSLSRRGTHMLSVAEEDVYFLESNSVELSDYEDLDVTVRGVLEKNIDPKALPVLLVDSITLPPVNMVKVEVTSLGLLFEVPKEWNEKEVDDGASFTLTGAIAPIMKVYKSSLSSLPTGHALSVGSRNAVRVSDEGEELVYVRVNRDVIVFSMNTALYADAKSLQSFLRSLRTVQVTAKSTASGSTLPTTGTGGGATGIPCGGAAGILCPSGSYCAITDPVEGIGRCTSVR